MIIHYLNIVGTHFPPETDPPLLIDADAMLAAAVTFQSFQLIAGRHGQMTQLGHSMQLQKLSSRGSHRADRPGDVHGKACTRELVDQRCFGEMVEATIVPRDGQSIP